MATNKLSELTLNRVALVDSPANKGARILLWKRDASAGPMKLVSKFAKLIGIMKDGTHVDIDPASLSESDPIEQGVAALALTFKDADGDAAALKKASDDFAEFVKGADPVALAAALAKAGFQVTAAGVVEKISKQENADMASEALKKSLGLKADATDADVEAAITAQSLTTKRLQSVVKMSADARAHYDGLEDSKKGGFADMTPAEQDAAALEAKKKPAAKSASDEAIEKANNTATEALAKVAKMEDERALDVVVKRVEQLKFIGKADDIGALIHKVGKVDKDAGVKLEETFKALNAQIEKGELFRELGNGRTGPVGKALDTINAKADELKKADPKLTIEKARMLARQQNPEVAKQEEIERKEQQKRAA